MNIIHDNNVNNVNELNLLHDILNPSKRTKNINSHYCPILDVCMNTRRSGAIFENLLGSGCSSIISTRGIIKT